MAVKDTLDFIEQAKSIHGDKYDYSLVNFKNMNTCVSIFCKKHGLFEQTPKAHITHKYGCKKCGREKCGEKLSLNNETFISKATKVHGDRYDYSLVKYQNAYTDIDIICKKHGIFTQVPHDHLKGSGCPLCGEESTINGRKYNNTIYINRASLRHGGIYLYDKTNVDQRDDNGKVIITCKKHGDFLMNPSLHLSGQGCPLCGREKIREALTNDISFFIEKANYVHSGKYNYDKVVYEHTDKKVIITCPIHGDFTQTPHDHLQGAGCPSCAMQLSKAENEIYDLCCSYLGKENVRQRVRDVIKPKEIDIYIQSLKIGIEFNGLRWHSEKFGKDKTYHIDKLNECKKNGIRLIQIFEDEYIFKKDIVLNKIKHLLKVNINTPLKIMGRKCTIKEINHKTSCEFLNKYHIQGSASASVYIGAFYEDKLISVMIFKHENTKNNTWELNRFASDYNYVCQGVGGKLFKWFIKKYDPLSVKSFADRRWTINENNNVYTNLGFDFIKYTEPDYRYYKETDGCIRYHKFGFRKQILHKKYNLPLSMTENEMTETLGYSKIYDCGLIKYLWTKK